MRKTKPRPPDDDEIGDGDDETESPPKPKKKSKNKKPITDDTEETPADPTEREPEGHHAAVAAMIIAAHEKATADYRPRLHRPPRDTRVILPSPATQTPTMTIALRLPPRGAGAPISAASWKPP